MMYVDTIIAIVLGLLSIFDIRKRAIPTVLVLAGLLLSTAYGVYGCIAGSSGWLLILGGLLPGTGMLAMAWVTNMAGYGDGLVLMALGIIYGFQDCFFLLCASLFLLSICSVILLGIRKVKGNTRMPYIPFLGIAYMINWGMKLI